MEVNFMGAVTTSQAFIPLLRSGQQKGRIVNVSSVVGAGSQLGSCSRFAVHLLVTALTHHLCPAMFGRACNEMVSSSGATHVIANMYQTTAMLHASVLLS
jgi:NAD(P)-dependent dehydrogenase (short-subunit alcohol dehydrogenase family)